MRTREDLNDGAGRYGNCARFSPIAIDTFDDQGVTLKLELLSS
jgi:hypothetical protein